MGTWELPYSPMTRPPTCGMIIVIGRQWVEPGDVLARLRGNYLDESPDLRRVVEPLFWLALALAQWKLGRLDDETRRNALAIIDSGKEIERWRELEASERI